MLRAWLETGKDGPHQDHPPGLGVQGQLGQVEAQRGQLLARL